MKWSEDKVAPYVTLRILLGSKMHIEQAEKSTVFQNQTALELHCSCHPPIQFTIVFEHLLWLEHEAGAGGIKMNRTERILALVQLRICMCVCRFHLVYCCFSLPLYIFPSFDHCFRQERDAFSLDRNWQRILALGYSRRKSQLSRQKAHYCFSIVLGTCDTDL